MRMILSGLVILIGGATCAFVLQQLMSEGGLGPAAMTAAAALGLLLVALVATLLLYRTRYRTLIGNLWLAAFSVLVTYFALDLAAGWILIKPLSPPLVPDEVRHHKLVPDSYAEFQQRDFHYIQRVNRFGLRGRDINPDKPSDVFRIIMLGDSFTMGKGVEDDQTFSVLVEQLLNESGAACQTRIEVLNGGVDSYAPILSLLQLKDLQPQLKPDMAVLNLDVSDLVQETAYRSQAARTAEGEIVGVPQHAERESIVDRIRFWTERNLFFTRVVLLYAIRLLGYRELTVRDVVTTANEEVVAYTLAGDKDRSEEWRNLFESISALKDFSVARGMEFLLTVYPWAHEISETEWIPGRYAFMPKDAQVTHDRLRRIEELSNSYSIPLLDVTPAFRAYNGKAPLYFSYDMHWTTAGHQVMAKALAEHLAQHHSDRWCR